MSERGTLTGSGTNSNNLSVWFGKEIPDGPVKVAPGSYLTASTWFDGKYQVIRVFFQDPEGHIQEVGRNGTAWGRRPSPGI